VLAPLPTDLHHPFPARRPRPSPTPCFCSPLSFLIRFETPLSIPPTHGGPLELFLLHLLFSSPSRAVSGSRLAADTGDIPPPVFADPQVCVHQQCLDPFSSSLQPAIPRSHVFHALNGCPSHSNVVPLAAVRCQLPSSIDKPLPLDFLFGVTLVKNPFVHDWSGQPNFFFPGGASGPYAVESANLKSRRTGPEKGEDETSTARNSLVFCFFLFC